MKQLAILLLLSAMIAGCQSGARSTPSDAPAGGSAFDAFAGCWAAPVDGFCIDRGSSVATVTWRHQTTNVRCTAQARLTLLATNSIQISQPQTPRACTNGDSFVAQEYYCNLMSPTRMDCWNVFTSGSGQEQRVTVVFNRM
ncbi:MAG: hypothetical protein H6843_16325 [Rhodospirillaceae bacterium]|nr:hypothetical protein [Rhodospirillaceae bacterium]